MMPPRSPIRRRIGAVSVSKLMVAMIDNSLTVQELADECGLSLGTTRNYVLTLHREGGCHITHWEPDSRGAHVKAAYRLGKGADAKKPRANQRKRCADWRARQRHIKTVHQLAGNASAA